MEIEKIEIIGLNVKNLDEAVKFFSDLLGIKFITPDFTKVYRKRTSTEHANPAEETKKVRYAIDTTGYMELLESEPPYENEGMRNIHFKVPDIEKAKAEMKRKGVRLLADVQVGKLKEAVYCPDDLHGCRMCLLEYDGPSAIEAITRK